MTEFAEASRVLIDLARGPLPGPKSAAWVGVGCDPAEALAWDSVAGSLFLRKWRGGIAGWVREHGADGLRGLMIEAAVRLERTEPWTWGLPERRWPSGVGAGTYGMKGTDGVRAAIEAGAPLVDTAEGYGFGRVEEALGPALAGFRGIVASKVSRNHMSAAAVAAACARSAAKLHRSVLDLYQVHWPRLDVPPTETMAALARLRDAGRIASIGVCNVSVDLLIALQRALPGGHEIATVQNRLNPGDLEAAGALLPYCKAKGRLFLAHSPLGQGEHPAAPTLRWLLSLGGVMPIPGSNNPAHARENQRAGREAGA